MLLQNLGIQAILNGGWIPISPVRSAFSYEIPLSHASSGSFRIKEELLEVLPSELIDVVHLTDEFESLPGSISAKITQRYSADQRIRSWTSENR
jgi:hypothetical protein